MVTPYLIYEALQQLDESVDAEQIINKIKQLDLGLPAEDEFSMILCWLNRCRLVHKLGQEHVPPEASKHYRVPDLLAIFDYDNKQLPVLIEVKTTKKPKLSWRPDYYESLKRYSDELGLPLLLAWKWRFFGLWVLVDLNVFRKDVVNYNLSFSDAMADNLMGVLAGDFFVHLHEGTGIHIRAKKEKLVKQEQKGEDIEEQWLMKVDDVYLTGKQGIRVEDPSNGAWSWVSASRLETRTEFSDSHVLQSFVVDEESPSEFASRALPILFSFFAAEEKEINWRQKLANYQFPVTAEELRAAAKDGLAEGFIRYVMHQQPCKWPPYLHHTTST